MRTKCFIYVLLAHENNSTSLFCTQSAQAMGYHCGTEYTGDGVSLRNGVEANANVIVWFEPTRV